MQDNIRSHAEQYVKKHKWRKVWHRIVSALACVVVFCTTYALILPVITAQQLSYCGIEEHQHSDSCYEMCSIYEYDKTNESGYCSNSDISYEKVLVCKKEEHCHSLSCYSNPNADLEAVSDWESTISDITLTGNRADDLIAVAESQLGYTESEKNYTVTEYSEMNGITRYGQWYGDPYGDWSAMFVSFCLNYAGIPEEEFPYESDCRRWIETLKKEEYDLYQSSDDYNAAPGDLIFFGSDDEPESDHVGIVAEIIPSIENISTQIIVIEGDSAGKVASVIYTIDDERIIGYARIPEKTAEEPVNEAVEREITLIAAIFEDESYTRLSQDETMITVTGLLPTDAEVRAYPMPQDEGDAFLCSYDISIFLSDGTIYEPSNEYPVTVSIHSPEIKNLDDEVILYVYYVPEDGDLELVGTQSTESGVEFEADHFSVYAVKAANATSVGSATALKNAIDGKAENIQLTANISTSQALTVPTGADIILDLNGHSLTATGTGALFTIPSGAALTIIDSQQAAETVEIISGDVAGNAASLSNGTLTYYITTTDVTNSATGATQESLEKHTINASGAIVGGSQPVFQVTGGTLNIQSGMIRGGTGRAITITGGIANINGGYICGFTKSSESTSNTDAFGGAIRASGGSLNLQGGVLAGNIAQNGGAIYATGSTNISIAGGIISGNTANRVPTNGWNGHSESGAYRCGGAGIYSDSNVTITMSSGYVTNNVAVDTGYFDGGGGMFLSGNTSMELTGGYITGNYAQGGSGIRTDFGKYTKFTMTGGFVSANVAATAEGGGVTIDRNGVGTITGGYITNNIIPTTVHWGGGGLFCADGSTLNLKNTLITENTAGGFGAGVAGCPTGNLYLYVTEGCAIYDNTDTIDSDSPHFVNGGAKDGIDAERCTELFQSHGHADYFCALQSTVTGIMMGDNAANWHGSADQQPVIADAEDVLSATQVMGLQAFPTEEAKNEAQSVAKVYINGNYSYTHGGGIMCNGNLVIGVPVDLEVPAHIDLQASKKLVDDSGNFQSLEDNDFSFKVTMTEPDGTVITSGTCDSNGNISFDHQLTFKQEGTYVYYVYEEANSGNPFIEYDNTIYRLTMTVSMDSGVAWYGDTVKYTYSITSLKVERSDDGQAWTQISNSSTSQSGIIELPLSSDTTFTNYLIEPTKVSVRKEWEGGIGAESVTAILKRDGEEIDRQILSAVNNWSYTWDNLESGYEYSVEEAAINGYTASYEVVTSTDNSGSTSLGQGSWWVPATELVAGQKYLIVNQDGNKALCVASGGEGNGFDSADVADITLQETAITVNGQTYSAWYREADVKARSIYVAEALTRNSNSGIILKRSSGSSYPYLRLESNNNNYLKGASSTTYASFMAFDGTYLKGHNASQWSPSNLRTIIYGSNKFNSTTTQSPSNAAKLYTLVSGEATMGSTVYSATFVITNTKNAVPEYELPNTGGIGTALYTISGLFIIICTGTLWIFSCIERRKGDSENS